MPNARSAAWTHESCNRSAWVGPGDPCPICEAEAQQNVTSPRFEHVAGTVEPDRGDGLHWLCCVDCGELWAERNNGSFAKGKRYCDAAT